MLWYRRLEQVVRSGKLCFVGNGAKRSLLTNIGDHTIFGGTHQLLVDEKRKGVPMTWWEMT